MYGVDLATAWRSRRWRRLLNLIDGLPAASHKGEAMAQDDELAQDQARELSGQLGEPTRSLTEWTTETELLTLLVDLLGEHLAFTAAVNSTDHKVHHPKPLPRPVRAIDRAMAHVMDDLFDDLMSDIEAAQGEG